MKSYLIILINDFPYNIGEPFFETELPFLSKKFDKIILFSVNGKINEKETRSYPKNVDCYPLSCNHNRIKYTLLGLFSKQEIFNLKEIKGKKKLSAAYLLGKNNSIYKKIYKILLNILKPDDSVLIYSYWLTLGISAIRLKQRLSCRFGHDIKLVSRCHGYDVYSEMMPFNFHPFQETIISFYDLVAPCSEFGANYLKAKYPCVKEKIQSYRLGTIDYGISTFSNEKCKVLVTCSGLRPVKRLDLFANAFVILAHENENIRWFCIGDGEQKSRIIDILQKGKVLDKVEMVGNIPNSEIFNIYKKMNFYFFINVSASEGIPVSIMEAISFGIPVIATDVGGNSEIVEDSNGYLIKKDIAPEELSNFIKEVLNLDGESYLNKRVNARKKWNSYYNASINYEKWSNLLLGYLTQNNKKENNDD